MFMGHHIHAIDNKGRVSIPSGYRVELKSTSDHAPILTSDVDCLRLYPWNYWCSYQRRVLRAAEIDPDGESLARALFADAEEAPIDKQGRISVPPRLREYAHLDREAAIVGCGDYIELWDRSAFEANLSGNRARIHDLKRAVQRLLQAQGDQGGGPEER